MRKKILALTLAAIMAFSFTACGGNSDTESTQSDSEQEEQVADENTSEVNSDDIQGMGDFYKYMGTSSDELSYTISPKAEEFINTHEDLVPAKSEDSISDYVDSSIEFKKVSKNQNNFGDKIMKVNEAYVIDILEDNISEDQPMSIIQAMDADGNCYFIIHLDSVEIYKEDTIKFYGVPVGMTSYENVSGGTTISLVIAGSYVEKTE